MHKLTNLCSAVHVDHSIFVGDLAPEVTDYMLQEHFRQYYPSVRSAKVCFAALAVDFISQHAPHASHIDCMQNNHVPHVLQYVIMHACVCHYACLCLLLLGLA